MSEQNKQTVQHFLRREPRITRIFLVPSLGNVVPVSLMLFLLRFQARDLPVSCFSDAVQCPGPRVRKGRFSWKPAKLHPRSSACQIDKCLGASRQQKSDTLGPD